MKTGHLICQCRLVPGKSPLHQDSSVKYCEHIVPPKWNKIHAVFPERKEAGPNIALFFIKTASMSPPWCPSTRGTPRCSWGPWAYHSALTCCDEMKTQSLVHLAETWMGLERVTAICLKSLRSFVPPLPPAPPPQAREKLCCLTVLRILFPKILFLWCKTQRALANCSQASR